MRFSALAHRAPFCTAHLSNPRPWLQCRPASHPDTASAACDVARDAAGRNAERGRHVRDGWRGMAPARHVACACAWLSQQQQRLPARILPRGRRAACAASKLLQHAIAGWRRARRPARAACARARLLRRILDSVRRLLIQALHRRPVCTAGRAGGRGGRWQRAVAEVQRWRGGGS